MKLNNINKNLDLNDIEKKIKNIKDVNNIEKYSYI